MATFRQLGRSDQIDHSSFNTVIHLEIPLHPQDEIQNMTVHPRLWSIKPSIVRDQAAPIIKLATTSLSSLHKSGRLTIMLARLSTAFVVLFGLTAIVNAGTVPAARAVGDLDQRSDAVGNYVNLLVRLVDGCCRPYA
ncbi:hypothetical protein EDB19DRAFT_2038996 [Suillus lakei]|nr:hypothetical protein EDB19DRAFT_2038996 [Suillus lakei]